MVVTNPRLKRSEPGLLQVKPQLDRPPLQAAAIRIPFPSDNVPDAVTGDRLAVGGRRTGCLYCLTDFTSLVTAPAIRSSMSPAQRSAGRPYSYRFGPPS